MPTITPSTALGDVTPSRANATTIPGQKKRSTMIAAVETMAPPNRGGLSSTHIHGTHVPGEEPSTASQTDIKGQTYAALLKPLD